MILFNSTFKATPPTSFPSIMAEEQFRWIDAEMWGDSIQVQEDGTVNDPNARADEPRLTLGALVNLLTAYLPLLMVAPFQLEGMYTVAEHPHLGRLCRRLVTIMIATHAAVTNFLDGIETGDHSKLVLGVPDTFIRSFCRVMESLGFEGTIVPQSHENQARARAGYQSLSETALAMRPMLEKTRDWNLPYRASGVSKAWATLGFVRALVKMHRSLRNFIEKEGTYDILDAVDATVPYTPTTVASPLTTSYMNLVTYAIWTSTGRLYDMEWRLLDDSFPHAVVDIIRPTAAIRPYQGLAEPPTAVHSGLLNRGGI